MEAINFDMIQQEVARKHHFTLSEDDPILATVTMCELIIHFYQQKTEGSLDVLYEKCELLASQQETNQKEIAARIINKSLSATEETIKSATRAVIEDFITSVAEQQGVLLKKQYKQLNDIKHYRNIAVVCALFSGLTALTVGLFLLMGLL